MIKEDFELWKEHNITKLLYIRLQRELARLEKDLTSEIFDTPESLYQKQRLRGHKDVLLQVLNLEAEDLTDEE